MGYQSTLEMSKTDWLKARQTGIGGSDVAAVLGIDPYKTALDVYREKIAETPAETPDNPALIAGRKLEAVVAEWFEEATGYRVLNDFKIRRHRKYPFLIANIDRLIVSQNGRGTGILEVKTTNRYSFRHWTDEGIPPQYYAQLQHYLFVTGHRWGAFAVLVDGREFYRFEVGRDEEFIPAMESLLIRFWKEHVEKRIPPEPQTKGDVLFLYPKSAAGKVVEAVPEVFDTYLELKNLQEKIKALQEEEKKLKDRLLVVMRDAEALTFDGKVLATFKSVTQTRLDTGRLKKEQPEIYAQYCKSIESRRFLIK